ncbi:unnamed protein product [Diatraea saccharalis]|uniref:WW domain-containing protein n=1 Tax=Diatraea saccharalis TaxID=40085 RepID=A0A9N9WAU8_9NEOP|nr:unnamed protein product [Diatraea saccharalis]
MNANKNEEKQLPDGWVLCSSKSNPGRKYYFNKKTGKSSWTQPQADDKSGQNKPKIKKTKSGHVDKTKKEDLCKKQLKRKSDGQGHSSPQKKKQKNDNPTHAKSNVPSPEKQTPSKYVDPHKKESPHSASKTYSANARLSQLRAQLEADCNKNDTSQEKSPSKSLKRSPTHIDYYSKIPRLELKSPNLNESKCSTTTQSPSSDSLQSIPSPSQFLAANKIISSMKAQLPEEYSDKVRQKSTFADIEEGINKQTPEYPFMKHPATPPQFSEASKLMSAIKSKLSYKGSVNDTPVKSFRSAKDRMEALRTRLSDEASTESHSFLCNTDDNNMMKKDKIEAMDVDFQKQIIQRSPSIQCVKETVASIDYNQQLVLVVDTNIFIHELDVIKDVLNSHIKGYSEQPNLLVPWRVINELDRLKDNNNGNGAICKRAKAAMDYLYKSLPENTRIKGQSLRDANSHIYPCELPDDEILNCCLQQSERGKSVILVSNDKNLCNKAVINGIRSVSLAELRPLLSGRRSTRAHSRLQLYRAALHTLLATILENEMRAKYNNLWEHVIFKPPPWTLSDVLQCLLKHWVAVFNEVFPRIEHLITELSDNYSGLKDKNPKLLTQSEVLNFKELCLEVARKCQIIPEYMELAKLTVDRILNDCENETNNDNGDGEMVVIEAFEGLWTVFSSYW